MAVATPLPDLVRLRPAGTKRSSKRDLIVHVHGLREPDLMYKIARTITTTEDGLLRALAAREQSVIVTHSAERRERELISLIADLHWRLAACDEMIEQLEAARVRYRDAIQTARGATGDSTLGASAWQILTDALREGGDL